MPLDVSLCRVTEGGLPLGAGQEVCELTTDHARKSMARSWPFQPCLVPCATFVFASRAQFLQASSACLQFQACLGLKAERLIPLEMLGLSWRWTEEAGRTGPRAGWSEG